MDLLSDPKWPPIDPRRVSESLKYAPHRRDANPRCLPGGGSVLLDQNGVDREIATFRRERLVKPSYMPSMHLLESGS
jgi:hypothetical protein